MQRTSQPDMFYGAKPIIFERAKSLRDNMTQAEKKLWMQLKNNKLGVRFKAQHPIDIFIADFYCHTHKLVVELDGEIHNLQVERDDGRTAEMERYGIKVIRFTNEEVINNIESVITRINEEITPKGDFGEHSLFDEQRLFNEERL